MQMTGFTFQSLKPQDSLSNELRSVIRDNVLQFYTKGLSTEAEEEGLTALYERLSQEDKLDGESNSIANQDSICFIPHFNFLHPASTQSHLKCHNLGLRRYAAVFSY